MADEVTVSGSLKFASGNKTFERVLSAYKASLTNKKFTHQAVNIGTSEEAVVLGEVSTLGWALFLNYDTTNYYEVLRATGSTAVVKVPAATADAPGFALFHVGTGITAPYLLANTAAVDVEYWIAST